MRYIIFSRVSTKMQTVDNQNRECIEYVNQIRNIDDELIVFEEPETSSRIEMEKRPVLQSMLNTITRGDTLVIFKLDRLARDGNELALIYRNKLIKRGVKVISLCEPQIDKAFIHIYAFVAETERESIRIRTISGLKNKQAKMEKVGTAWYGYKVDDDVLQLERKHCRSYKKPYKLIPHEDEVRALQLMKMGLDQGLSYKAIVDLLTKNHCMNRKGNPFQRQSVFRILKREKMNKLPKES